MSELGLQVGDLLTPVVRLGVTGLSRSGKTVFITGLVKCLCDGIAEPAFGVVQAREGFRAYLEPQPDDELPRFAYEEHLEALSDDLPRWPESTRRVSQLRLTLEWNAEDSIRQTLGITRRLHIDIIDYPGEWLIDLGLLGQSFAEWSSETLSYAGSESLKPYAQRFLEFQSRVEPTAPLDEQIAIEGARLYTEYIRTARQSDPSRAALGPGRFLLPGDLEGSPQLTFFPLHASADEIDAANSQTMAGLLNRRFEKYKDNVVRPFFEQHFSRIDKQIVLIDVLSALNGGAEALANLEHGLDGVMQAFRPGTNSWLSLFLPRRIDRIVFAATKADHIHHSSHERLEAVLEKAVQRAAKRAGTAGAELSCVALAALRATEDVDKTAGQETYHCIRGVPAEAETVSGKRFDGSHPAVVFPGDLPADPLDAFDPLKARPEDYQFVRFRPPGLGAAGRTHPDARWPHIGLGRAINFLFGDQFS